MAILGPFADRIGIDPDAFAACWRSFAAIAGYITAFILAIKIILGDQSEQIIIDEIVIQRFEIEVVGADIEVKRASVGRLQPQFQRPLASERAAERGHRDSVKFAQLRTGEEATRGRLEV